MIEACDIGKKPSETLRRIARYYLDKGYSKSEVRGKLESFILQCNVSSFLSEWTNAIESAIRYASKYEAINIDSIDVSEGEMKKVDSLEGKQIRRLAFTLLCLAKYWDIIIPQGDHWVNCKSNEIMKMANINTSIRRQGSMYHTLNEAGLIHFSKKVDNTNVKVCFIEDGKAVLQITDFRNLGYQYLMFHGEPYFACSNCGLTTKYNNPVKTGGQKYCADCAAKICIQQKVNSVMKYRNRHGSITHPDTYTVYMHECPNGKRYIGMTSTPLQKRWKKGVGYVNNTYFYSDIEKYGWNKINHYKIAVTQNEETAKGIKTSYIKKYGTFQKEKGYNRTSKNLIHEYDESIIDRYPPLKVDGNGDDITVPHEVTEKVECSNSPILRGFSAI